MRFPALPFALALCLAPLCAQPGGSSEAADPEIARKIDSLRRVISLRILSDAEKKEIRACDRDKAKFLADARAAEPGCAQVDKALNEAKLAGANPNDPNILALMEKKFTFERTFDQRFYAAARGKKCGEGEEKRAKALTQALEKDKQYQALLKQARSVPGQTL